MDATQLSPKQRATLETITAALARGQTVVAASRAFDHMVSVDPTACRGLVAAGLVALDRSRYSGRMYVRLAA